MCRNFRVNISRNSDSLHLFPQGEFDGSSASVLVRTLESYRNGSGRIVVHTDGLTRIHPFGAAVFQDHLLRIQNGSAVVEFTGEQRHCIAPE